MLSVRQRHDIVCVCRNATCTSWGSACTGRGAGSGTLGCLGRPQSRRQWMPPSRESFGMRRGMAPQVLGQAVGASVEARTGNEPTANTAV